MDTTRGSNAILRNYIFSVLLQVKKSLHGWEIEAKRCLDPELRKQALSSLNSKAFHCQGGAVFAVPYDKSEPNLLRLIVAYQTLCDYLDNLCDRAGSTNGQAFRQLHLSLLDALNPEQSTRDYYKYYPMTDDGDYINKLVRACQVSIKQIPHYEKICDDALRLAELYSDLQVKKHLETDVRHDELMTWACGHLNPYQELFWPEYCAATGSTLALFALFKLAAGKTPSLEITRQVISAYFPWICGLHILLDYFIDRAEDREGGDLNFTFYYENDDFMLERLKLFTREALHNAQHLPNAHFHTTVVNGLLAMYLSDRKIKEQGFQYAATHLLTTVGPQAWQTYYLCRLVRMFL